ncbi:outer membrane protein OmpK [Entomohabitans teleogrylli]|uniref:nucleoside-specific channel-forming Tsx family protein n=1 Tax=Entomohabitans teleogrylli TaxID=1384589 RepID=UPI00073D4EC3|nr:outer membrane protein OmpK [Entomohabitans teleogrylli]
MKAPFCTSLGLALLAISSVASAEFKSGFINAGFHYLDWSDNTTHRTGSKSHKDDFGYLELEGGANFSWGEMYGFFDWENFYRGRHSQPGSEQRYTMKSTNRIKIGETGFNLYLHGYGTYGSPDRRNFHDDMLLYGIGYNVAGAGYWFKPFIAKRYTDQTWYRGDNGYVAGWVAGYRFKLVNETFSLTNWNEYEFARADSYAKGNGGKEGLNGALALWWHSTPHLTAGIQYRYADNKLGESFLQNALIYSIKYQF